MRFTTTLATAAILAVSGVTANAGGLAPVVLAEPIEIVVVEESNDSSLMWILGAGLAAVLLGSTGSSDSSM